MVPVASAFRSARWVGMVRTASAISTRSICTAPSAAGKSTTAQKRQLPYSAYKDFTIMLAEAY